MKDELDLVFQGWIFGGDVLQTIEHDIESNMFYVSRERDSDGAKTVDKASKLGLGYFIDAFNEKDQTDCLNKLKSY